MFIKLGMMKQFLNSKNSYFMPKIFQVKNKKDYSQYFSSTRNIYLLQAQY